ncbi:hypothetical protein [Flavobacterium salmonis]|uniref:Uncharacterized protein n=1 Tax=Flavobacterium salmonis TaxID=2654844 RepID=A0A6V6Z463_9FLAO|nr:hypothetical protein [Flavobacterium salmonis]CAD0006570.1 hypothetical protein FLAT13_03353 [Flavobacterium salmonis]
MKKTTLLKILIGLVSVLILLFSLSLINSNYIHNQSEKEYGLSSDHEAEQKYLHDLTIKNRNIRNNWSNYINVSTNQYSYYGIGGIENLKIVCKNDTPYVIDELYVDVCYVIDDGSCYKIESIVFNNVPANSEVQKDAPNSSRGKKVSLDILDIYSDKLNFLYNITTPLPDGTNDPYFSKVRRR